jgi:3-methylcrotonyl-CoA carboxylase beta subunit
VFEFEEFPQIKSRIRKETEEFKEFYSKNKSTCEFYKNLIEEVKNKRDENAVKLHRERGKLLARERVYKLVDNGEFFELSPLAAYGMYENQAPQAGIITGIGKVCGNYVVIVSNDATVKGGTYFPETVKKHLRAQEIAEQNRIPAIYLVDSGGAFLPLQSEVFPDKDDFGRIFFNQAKMSAKRIPQISAVMGMCTAGGAYVPAMSDECVIVKGVGTIYLGGPPLVKASTGEDVTEEELGGAVMHARVSGVVDHLAENDEEAIKILRRIISTLGNFSNPKKIRERVGALEKWEEPLYPLDEVLGIIPPDLRRPFDMREVIARIVDGSRFLEFKKDYGQTLVCGFARIKGILTGIIANNGVLFSESALKGAHFIELCNQRRIPIIFLQNIAGFMVGKKYEEGGIVKHGAKMVQAVSTASVPKITVIIGGSHGAGNYAMAGRAYEPRFLFMWPTGRISVMGAKQAALVLVNVKKNQLKRYGKELSKDEEEKIYKEVYEKYEAEGNPLYSASRLWDDGIIFPENTRDVLALCLEVSLNSLDDQIDYPVFRM